jgi:hypothetical protein
MTQVAATQSGRKALVQRLWKVFLPVGGVAAALGFIAFIYLGYDLVKGEVSPCEGIFRQASVGLTTKIEFLKAKSELKLGSSKVVELSERAEMAALSLKTCCTVLDAGRINPEQFLECKAKTRTYDARIEDIAAIVRAALPGAAGTASAAPAAPALESAVDTARAASRDLNTHVVQVAADQDLKVLRAVPAARLKVDAAEREPNDDGLNANLIELAKTVKGAIGPGRDADVYTFTTPATYRDWIRIEVENQSTTLEPNIQLFDADKANIGAVSNTTAGGNANTEFVAPPSATFSVRVASHYGTAIGVYIIRVLAKKAYDAHEPNDDILGARRIMEGVPVKASIMDKNDVDVFSIAGASGERTMSVTIANGSATLHPNVVVYDAAKTQVGATSNTTPGGDVAYSFKAPKGLVYVRVADHYSGGSGDYTLTIAAQ